MDKGQYMQPPPPYPTPPIIPGGVMPGAVMVVSTGPPVGPQPNRVCCPSCNADIITRVEYKATTRTHCMALLLCLLCIPCAVIPYFMDSCNNANHYCPSCGSYIGTYAR